MPIKNLKPLKPLFGQLLIKEDSGFIFPTSQKTTSGISTEPVYAGTSRISNNGQTDKVGGLLRTIKSLLFRNPLVFNPISSFIAKKALEIYAPVVKPTYQKIRAGEKPIEAYKKSWQELSKKEQEQEELVKKELEEAKQRGASSWELSKITAKSPRIQKLTFSGIGFIGGLRFVNSKEAGNLIIQAVKSKLTRQDLLDITRGVMKDKAKLNAYKSMTANPNYAKEIDLIAKNKKVPLIQKISDYLKERVKPETTVEPARLAPKAITAKKGIIPQVKAIPKEYDLLPRATKGVKEVKPVVKPKDEFDTYIEKEFGKITPKEEAEIWKSEAIKEVGGAIETGKISPEFENKTITEMRRIKGFTNPKNVPTERLSIFDNFINLNKIKRANVPYKQMGIAEIVRGDKVFPAIRQQSGFYADKEIQTTPIGDVYNQLLSPYHMALKQDGYKLGGKFGIMFQKVWKPTEKAIRGQKEFTGIYFKTIKDIGRKHKIVASRKNLEHLSDVIERKVKATPQEEVFIRDIRNVLDDLRNQANDIRLKMRRGKIGYITDYIPHMQKASLWNELLSNVATISDNLDFIIPNQAKNPFTYHRLLQEMPKAERNLYILLDRYIRAISKDIYITPAIENIKAYNSVLKNRELFNASKYWDEYIRVGLIGKQHKLDAAMSIGQTGRKRLQKWNSMLNKAFLTGKLSWNIATQPLSYITNVPMEAGIINSVKAIHKSFGKGLRQYVKENSNVLAIKTGDVRAVAVGEGRNIQNRIYQTKISKWNDFLSMLGSVEERELTLTSYIAGLERAKDLGYKGQDALDFADLTTARTQSMYNKENRALILDSDVARFAFPFSSFSVEMYNHILEIGTKKGAESLKARQRLGKLFRLLVGVYSANLYAKTVTGRKKTTIGTFFPFVGNYIDLLVSQVMGESYYGGRSPMTVIQIGQDVIKGSKDFIKYGNIHRLRKVAVNFGLALGGIGGGGQINNIIDGIMADIDEEVKSVSGKTMFEVKDALSKVIAPFFGVWSTLEGREYFEPKEKEIPPIRGKSRIKRYNGKSRI